MINIDNKIKEQLDAIIETMNILQKHWYEAGAIIDDEGVYDVNIIESGSRVSEFKLRYIPLDKIVELHTIGRYHDHKMVMQYSKDEGLLNFNFPLTADARAELTSAIFSGVNTLELVSTKAMKASPKFAVQVKSQLLLECINELKSDLEHKSSIQKHHVALNEQVKSAFISGKLKNKDQARLFEFTIDQSSGNVQFYKATPTGENDNLLMIDPKGRVQFQVANINSDEMSLLLEKCIMEVKEYSLEVINELQTLRMLTELPGAQKPRDFDRN